MMVMSMDLRMKRAPVIRVDWQLLLVLAVCLIVVCFASSRIHKAVEPASAVYLSLVFRGYATVWLSRFAAGLCIFGISWSIAVTVLWGARRAVKAMSS